MAKTKQNVEIMAKYLWGEQRWIWLKFKDKFDV